MELHTEASVFGGGAPVGRVSNGNIPQCPCVRSSTRATGCCGPTQSGSALLSQVSGRRAGSHQPHHGPVIQHPPQEEDGGEGPPAASHFHPMKSNQVLACPIITSVSVSIHSQRLCFPTFQPRLTAFLSCLYSCHGDGLVAIT